MEKNIPNYQIPESTFLARNNRLAAFAGAAIASIGLIAPSYAESETQVNETVTIEDESVSTIQSIKTPSKKKLTCKKAKRIRDNNKRPLKKKEKKFLKNKCGIKYPNIIGSTKNTKISGSIAYNWGPEPTDTGIIITKNGYDAPDETYFDFNNLLQTKFSSTGQPIVQKGISSNNYYRFNNGDRTKAFQFDQPLLSNNPDSYDYGTLLDFTAVNLSDESRGLNISLKDYPSYQNIFVESSINLPPGESVDIVIADSPNQPLSMLGHQGVSGQNNIQPAENSGLYILTPDNEKTNSLKSVSRAVLKICVISDIPQEHCYTRAVVTGKSNLFD